MATINNDNNNMGYIAITRFTKNKNPDTGDIDQLRFKKFWLY